MTDPQSHWWESSAQSPGLLSLKVTSCSNLPTPLGPQGATPISNILGDLLARRWWFTPKHAYNGYTTKSTHIRQVKRYKRGEKRSPLRYIWYIQCLPVGLLAKGHETPNPNKQEASNPQTILNPLNNPKKAFPSVISHAHYQPPPQQMGVGRVIAPLDDLNNDIFKTIL